MLDIVIAKLADPHFLAILLSPRSAAAATVSDRRDAVAADRTLWRERMKAVSDGTRAHPRCASASASAPRTEQGAAARQDRAAHQATRRYASVSTRWLGTEKAKAQLAHGRLSRRRRRIRLSGLSLIAPIVFFLVALVYVFLIIKLNQPVHDEDRRRRSLRLSRHQGAGNLSAATRPRKRQKSMERAFPNTLDLLLICAESGMSIEHAVRKVSQEIGIESIAHGRGDGAARGGNVLSRRTAAWHSKISPTRTGLEFDQLATTVLIQAERYGTPLGAGAARPRARKAATSA